MVGIPTVEIPKPSRPNLPDPEPIDNSRKFKFKILTEKDKLVKGQAFIALSPKDYENLALTMADIVRWIKEAQWRIQYYKGEEITVIEPKPE